MDDFALYGRLYGTLLVDGDTRLPITLWEGRDAETLRDWLQAHPGVQIACRDGSPIYRQGITSGAPDAVQVSDRFHLWRGLSRRVQQIATVHRGCLPAAIPEPEPAPPASADTKATPSADSRAANHARHLFETVHALTDSGHAYNAIARQLGLNWRTVRKYATATNWQQCVRRPRPRVPSPLDPYLEYLQQRWDEGEHNAKLLHQELKAKGFLGHYQRVKMAIAVRIRVLAEVQAITADLGRGRAVAQSEVALAQPPVMKDRDVRVAECDLGCLDRAAQIRCEHRGDAVVAAPPAHLGGVGAATLAEPSGQPPGCDAPLVVLGQRMSLEHDRDRHHSRLLSRFN